MGKSLLQLDDRTKRRNASEKRFRAYGMIAIALGVMALLYLFGTIISKGSSAFQQAAIDINVVASQDEIEKANKSVLKTGEFAKIITRSLREKLDQKGVKSELSDKELLNILSKSAGALVLDIAAKNPAAFEQGMEIRALASPDIDGYLKGRVTRESVANNKTTSPAHLDLADALQEAGILNSRFNWNFIIGTDSGEERPESAGFGAAMMGSLAMMLVVIALAIPIGVASSIYLEEFAPKNLFTDIIEVSISNLAAVPSIVFGIFGLALFINLPGEWVGSGLIASSGWFRNNAPFIGGLVLTLMTLPRIIIPSRAALKAVPPSIRDAALGIGASKMQTIFHHVLPLAMPGILTGTIIGLAQALGETAPLLLVGLVGYIGHTMPETMDAFFAGPNTVMPAQIYTWTTRANPAWYEKAWGGIIILLVFLIAMNFLAIVLRRKFERRW